MVVGGPVAILAIVATPDAGDRDGQRIGPRMSSCDHGRERSAIAQASWSSGTTPRKKPFDHRHRTVIVTSSRTQACVFETDQVPRMSIAVAVDLPR